MGSVHSASFLPLRDPHAMSAESSSCIACPYKEFQVPRSHIYLRPLSPAYPYPHIIIPQTTITCLPLPTLQLRKRYCNSMFTPLKYLCIYTRVRRVGKCWHKIICQIKFSHRKAIAARRLRAIAARRLRAIAARRLRVKEFLAGDACTRAR